MNLINKQNAIKNAAIEFCNGADINYVMKKYDVCYASIYNGIKKFNLNYNYTYGRIHSINEDYFKTIDTEEKAYWLGFIMADGTVIKTNQKMTSYNRLKLALKLEDEYHLEKFKQCINTTTEIKHYTIKSETSNCSKNKYTYCYINCDSIKIANDLINLGCIPNKTDKCFIPNIPQNLIRHFVRGYFDGDGCISVYKDTNTKKLRGEFSITSNSNILIDIQKILIDNCNVKETKLHTYKRTKKAASLRYGGKNQIRRIYEYLYKDSTIYLNRKYNNFKLLLS